MRLRVKQENPEPDCYLYRVLESDDPRFAVDSVIDDQVLQTLIRDQVDDPTSRISIEFPYSDTINVRVEDN